MNFWGSGFITQIIYGAFGNAADDFLNLLTESSIDILTESGDDLQVED